jgi:hypothetical protein
MGKSDEKYSDEEAQRRFMQSLKGAVRTPPKPPKNVQKKRSKKQPEPPKKMP